MAKGIKLMFGLQVDPENVALIAEAVAEHLKGELQLPVQEATKEPAQEPEKEPTSESSAKLCQCGCGKELTGRRTKWATDECSKPPEEKTTKTDDKAKEKELEKLGADARTALRRIYKTRGEEEAGKLLKSMGVSIISELDEDGLRKLIQKCEEPPENAEKDSTADGQGMFA